MSLPTDTGELWFLTGSQHLYGAEVLAQVACQSELIAKQLSGSDELSVPVVWQPVLTDAPTRSIPGRNEKQALVKQFDIDQTAYLGAVRTAQVGTQRMTYSDCAAERIQSSRVGSGLGEPGQRH